MDARSQPVLYSLSSHLFASGTLVIFTLAASYFNVRPVLKDNAYKLIASVICSASVKFPGYCFPVLQALINSARLAATLSSWVGFLSFTLVGMSSFLPEIISGFWRLNPASILPLSPMNIIPSAGNSLFSSCISIGVGGRMPPSYQQRSTEGLAPFAGYLNRTVLAIGNEKSFLI